MGTESSNVAALKDAYRQWHETKGGSTAHWLALMTDDVKFHSLADGAKAMEFTCASSCKDDVTRYFAGLAGDWEMIFYTIDEYIAQGDRVVALGRCSFRHRKTGKILETPKADFHKFRGDKICEFFEFYDTAKAIGVATPR